MLPEGVEIVDRRFVGRGDEFRAVGAAARAGELRALADLDGDDWKLPMTHTIEENVELAGVEVRRCCGRGWWRPAWHHPAGGLPLAARQRGHGWLMWVERSLCRLHP